MECWSAKYLAFFLKTTKVMKTRGSLKNCLSKSRLRRHHTCCGTWDAGQGEGLRWDVPWGLGGARDRERGSGKN